MANNVKQKRVGIIGSGIAGLTTAFILSQAGHDVEIFEREAEVTCRRKAHASNIVVDGAQS